MMRINRNINKPKNVELTKGIMKSYTKEVINDKLIIKNAH